MQTPNTKTNTKRSFIKRGGVRGFARINFIKLIEIDNNIEIVDRLARIKLSLLNLLKVLLKFY